MKSAPPVQNTDHPILDVRNLSKRFYGRQAIEEVGFQIKRGEICGLLGHNGAGKSTVLGILLGQVHPDSGEVFIKNHSLACERHRALERVGAIFEAPVFYDYLTGWENLQLLASCRGGVRKSDITEAVEAVGLESRIQDRAGRYSHGMRRRLALAQALMARPEILILDEPADGLDPEGIRDFRTILGGLSRERGVTILLSSHLLSEVALLCDRILILREGRIVFDGNWAERSSGEYRLSLDDWETASRVLQSMGIEKVSPCAVFLPDPEATACLIESLVRAGVRIHAVERIMPALEDLYFGHTSEDNRPIPTSAPDGRLD